MRPFLAVLLFAFLAAPAAAQTPVDTTPTIAADGTGTATLVPDIADFDVDVRRVAPTARDARDAANRRIAAVVRAVRSGGVAADDIRTAGLSITRERVRRRGRPTQVRYRASQSLAIRTRDVGKLGALLDAVAEAGADAIEAPDFGFADPSVGRLQATRAALADARRRADDAAAVAGLRITGVRTVDLDPSQDSSPRYSDSAAAAPAPAPAAAPAPTRVAPGVQEFSEQVRVVYTAAPLT